MEGRQRRSFTDDYKRQAVDLVASSGRTIGSMPRKPSHNQVGGMLKLSMLHACGAYASTPFQAQAA